MLLRLEEDMCMGAGYCAKSSPKLFRINDDGFATLNGAVEGSDAVEIAGADLEAGRDGDNICPPAAVVVAGT